MEQVVSKEITYLLKAEVSLMFRRWPFGGARVGEVGGVVVAMH